MDKYPNRKTAVAKMTETEFAAWGDECEDNLSSAQNTDDDARKQKAVALAQAYCHCSDLADEDAQKTCEDAVLAKVTDYTSGIVGSENIDTFKNVAMAAMLDCMLKD